MPDYPIFRKTASYYVDEISEMRRQLTAARDEAERLWGRVNELEDVCINMHRDLSIRAEPHDWDNPNSCKVVNLSAGYWDQLNDALGKSSTLSGLSAEAWLLRRQADAVEGRAAHISRMASEKHLGDVAVISHLQAYAETLRNQASDLEAGGSNDPT